jgi:Uma2 family endonuclease
MLTHMPSGIEKRRFNVDEYYAMAHAGILSERDRVELIEGEIVTMSPIGLAHAAAVNRANRALIRAAGDEAIVSPQNPIRLNAFNEPQPDLVLLRPREDFYRSTHAQLTDILLVIEIADSSLRYDRDVKASLYARHGIIEYWLVDLAAGTVARYTSPEDATYRTVAVHPRGEGLAPIALPGCTLTVEDLL